MRYFLVAIWLLIMCQWSFSNTGDSLQYLSREDTIYLKLGQYQEKILEHSIEAGQTLFSLAKFYGLSIDELFWYNPQLKNKTVSPGQRVKIPVPNGAIVRYKPAQFQPEQYIPVYYVVQAGESLYGICHRLFKMPMDTMMQRNNMDSHILKINQKLWVGWMSIQGISAELRKYKISPQWKKSEHFRGLYVKGLAYKSEYDEQGVAFWQKESTARTDLYALHRKAPINSVIAITNPMTNRTVYAKVIGKIPTSVYRNDVRVVVSSRVAQLLGARDPRFFVKIRFTK